MDDAAFDRALIAAAFEMAGETGWGRMSVAEAAKRGDLPLDRARARFPGRGAVLMRFGLQADRAALETMSGDTPRDRLFDLLMRRFDALQVHRDGVLALLREVPRRPGLGLLLGAGTRRSMRWMLDAAGVPTHGRLGEARTRTLVGIWLYGLRAWRGDTSEDLAATMAALDRGLDFAVRAESWLPAGMRTPAPAETDKLAADPLPDAVVEASPSPPFPPSPPPSQMPPAPMLPPQTGPVVPPAV